jgi:putative peptidoglycan lipid II flippase
MRTAKELLSLVKRLLQAEQNEIVSAAGFLIVITFATKILGMFFLTLVAKEFGASTETDLYYLASVLPETITNIILLGVISGSIIPIFINIREREGETKFWHSFNSTLNISMLFFGLLAFLAAIFSRQLIPLAVQLTQNTQNLSDMQINEVVWMMRILLIPQIILGLSAFFSTWLNIYHRFIIPQLAPLFYNIGKLIGVAILVPLMGGSIWGLVWGSIIGAVLHILIQIPLLRHLNFNFKILFIDIYDKNLKKVLKLGLPRVFSLGMEQIALIVDSLIALGLTAGSLTAYQLAVRLISLPMGLFGTNFAIASYPSFAKLYATDQRAKFSELFFKIMNQIIYLTLPMAVIFIVMRVPIVRLVYGIFGGNFTWEDTLLVAGIVLFFSWGLIFEGLRTTMFRVYFAIHNSIIPLFASIFVVVGGIITGILFSNYFSHFNQISLQALEFNPSYFLSKGDGEAGAAGLALSSSLVFTLEFIFMFVILYKKKVIFGVRRFLKALLFKLIAAMVMFIACFLMAKLWEEILNTTKTLQLIFLSLSTIISSFMIYIWTSYMLRLEEADLLVNLLFNNLEKLVNRVKKEKHVQKS